MVSPEPYAPLVCVNCKARKKKCDKALPSCGYCFRKGLNCKYASQQPREPSLDHAVLQGKGVGHECSIHPPTWPSVLLTDSMTHTTPSGVALLRPLADPTPIDMALYLEVRQIIQATGQFIDDISIRYFQGAHLHLPVVSRRRFHDHLMHIGGPPPPHFSILLLSISLVTYRPEMVPQTTQPMSRESLYLAVKSLYAQVQTSSPPFVHLIQAGALLALYEYARGKPDDAFLPIAGCARMGYAAQLHNRRPAVAQISDEEDEAINTWWGIVLCERLFFCELSTLDQPLVTIFPSHAQLPTVLEQHELGSKMQQFAVSVPIETRGLWNSVQAAWLLDQVSKTITNEDPDLRFIQLDELDRSLQSFLAIVMEYCQDIRGVFCGAVATSIRALFILHEHVLCQSTQVTSTNFKTMEEWGNKSHDTLDTATKMVIDITDSHENMAPNSIDLFPPNCAYIIQAALNHIHDRLDLKNGLWQEREKLLNIYLGQLNRRWGAW